MNDIKLLELPYPEWKAKDGVSPGVFTAEQMQSYALINVEYHTERLRHEVETLRDGLDYLATMKGVKDVLDLRAKAARAERLEEVLRQVQQKLEEVAMIRSGHGTFAGTYLLVTQVLEDQQGERDDG